MLTNLLLYDPNHLAINSTKGSQIPSFLGFAPTNKPWYLKGMMDPTLQWRNQMWQLLLDKKEYYFFLTCNKLYSSLDFGNQSPQYCKSALVCPNIYILTHNNQKKNKRYWPVYIISRTKLNITEFTLHKHNIPIKEQIKNIV